MSNGQGGGVSDGFVLGEWLVQPSLNRLSRGGETIQLRPKVMDVLVLLAGSPGEVVTKDAIIDAVWAKEFIADSALSRAVFELRTALSDDPREPRYIETIAKRGYRLVAPVQPEAEGVAAPRGVGVDPRDRWTRLAGGVGLAVAAGLIVTLAAPRRAPVADPGRPTILVLPFEQRGGQGSGYFAEGLSEEITARLVGVRDVTVVARRVGRASVPGEAEMARAGREMGATHVLWGTVQCREDRVRVMVQLVTSDDGWIEWADTFDRPARDPLAAQRWVAGEILARLRNVLKLSDGDEGAEVGTANVEARQAYLRAEQRMREGGGSADGQAVAVQLLERAVRLDPDFAAAHAALATASARASRAAFGSSPERCRVARAALARAQLLDPGSAVASKAAADVASSCDRDFAVALAELGRIPESTAPASPVAEREGDILRRQGLWAESTGVLERAARTDPGDVRLRRELALNYSMLGRHEESLTCADAALAMAPDDPTGFVAKADILRRAGRLTEGRASLAAMPSAGGADAQLGWYRQELAEGDFTAAVARALALASQGDVVADPWMHPSLLTARALWCAGRRTEARGRFEDAERWTRERLREAPENPRLLQALGFSLAGLGRPAEALAAGRRAVELVPVGSDAVDGALALESLAAICIVAGDEAGAVEALKSLLAVPSPLSVRLLETDAAWSSLRDAGLLAGLRAVARDGAS